MKAAMLKFWITFSNDDSTSYGLRVAASCTTCSTVLMPLVKESIYVDIAFTTTGGGVMCGVKATAVPETAS